MTRFKTLLHDGAMVYRRGEPCFGEEPCAQCSRNRSVMSVRDLDGDESILNSVARCPDSPHVAGSADGPKLVATGEQIARLESSRRRAERLAFGLRWRACSAERSVFAKASALAIMPRGVCNRDASFSRSFAAQSVLTVVRCAQFLRHR